MKLMFAAMANLTRVEFLAQVEWHFGTATDRLDLLLTVRRLVKERKGSRSCLLLDRSGQVLRVHGSGPLTEVHALGQGIWHPTNQSHLPTNILVPENASTNMFEIIEIPLQGRNLPPTALRRWDMLSRRSKSPELRLLRLILWRASANVDLVKMVKWLKARRNVSGGTFAGHTGQGHTFCSFMFSLCVGSKTIEDGNKSQFRPQLLKSCIAGSH